MCNAWNHPPGCTCGWGGEGHLGVNPYGNWGENYVTQSTDASVDSSTGWTIFNKEKKPLTFVTECWVVFGKSIFL
tara:strand:+ start:390 stop:614 length:225 start_codon:yes stop_codon:yes gene_type:complete